MAFMYALISGPMSLPLCRATAAPLTRRLPRVTLENLSGYSPFSHSSRAAASSWGRASFCSSSRAGSSTSARSIIVTGFPSTLDRESSTNSSPWSVKKATS